MADLRTILGDAYREGMTLAEVDTALADIELMTKADAETMATQRAAATKRLLDTANKKLADANKKSTDVGAENANLLERIAALEERDKANTRASEIATHKASLLAQGYTEELAAATAEALVDGNTAVVLANQGAFLAAQTAKIREEVMQGTKPPAGGNGGQPTMTKEELSKMTLAEKVKFAAENPDKYKEFYGGN